MWIRLLFILTFFPAVLFSAEPGRALVFDGYGVYANLQNSLKDVETISFWIKPNVDIDANTPDRQAVLMRSSGGSGFFYTEVFGVYFEKTNEPNAGKLVFACGNETAMATIASDRNTWSKDQWYHIAVIVDPNSGMRMYVNGTKQNEIASNVTSIYFRQEGVSEDLYLGKWGSSANDFLDAQLDEVRFFTYPRSETQIRAGMCHELSNAPGLIGYLQFESNSSTTVVSTSPANLGGALYNASGSNFIKSTAPVGQSSTYVYGSLGTQSLSFNKNYSITVDSITPMPTLPTGLHIYYTLDPTLGKQTGGKGWFGVWFDSPEVDYNVTLDYSALDNNCDSCSQMYSRDDQSKSSWGKRAVFAEACTFKEFKENTVKYALSQREEYTLTDTLELEMGLGDTVEGCTGNFLAISPNTITGATYVWDDSTYQRVLNVSESGYHHLEVSYRGCKVEKSVYVLLKPVPFFQLPNDTSICTGDTLWVKAPIDSASYSWLNGWSTNSTLGIFAPGKYSLTITIDGCEYTDYINVSLIPSFQINLGPDTTMCLGQELSYNFNEKNVNYQWWDGSTSGRKIIKNKEGKFWLKAWNSCFTRVDTVNVFYEECDCHIYVPNSFSPNGDGYNDVFFPVTSCFYEEFYLDITDRWGNTIFITTDVNVGWDGFVNGTKAPEGVYTYRTRYKKYTWLQESNYQHGVITLFN